jgi:hypothetical protein
MAMATAMACKACGGLLFDECMNILLLVCPRSSETRLSIVKLYNRPRRRSTKSQRPSTAYYIVPPSSSPPHSSASRPHAPKAAILSPPHPQATRKSPASASRPIQHRRPTPNTRLASCTPNLARTRGRLQVSYAKQQQKHQTRPYAPKLIWDIPGSGQWSVGANLDALWPEVFRQATAAGRSDDTSEFTDSSEQRICL